MTWSGQSFEHSKNLTSLGESITNDSCFISPWFLQVIFQAEEGRKQYKLRGREKQHVKVSDSSDDHISEEDNDFQPQPSWKKTTTTKGRADRFYRGVYGEH